MNNVDCIGCHQLGQESTRTIPAQLGEFKSGEEAWARRVASGQTGEWMVNRLAGQLGGVPFKYFGDWTDRVAKGELPKDKPARPQGVERNVVVTSWEWGTEKTLRPRPDLVRPAQSDGQRLRAAVRLARILDRRHPDPRPEDAQGLVLPHAVLDPNMPESLRAAVPRDGDAEADHAFALLGRREDLEPARRTTTTA